MNPYAGEVTVKLEEGLTVTLRVTWASRAMIRQVFGINWHERVSDALVTLNPTDLAVMLEAASNGQVDTGKALASDWPLQTVSDALRLAWRFSHHGIKEPEAVKDESPPMKPRQMWWKRLLRLLRLPG